MEDCSVDLGARHIHGVIGNAVADMCLSRYVPLHPCLKPGAVALFDKDGMIFSNKNRSIRTVNVRKEMDYLSEKLSRTAYQEVLIQDLCKKCANVKCDYLSMHHKQPQSALKDPPKPTSEQESKETGLMALCAAGSYVGRELIRQISVFLNSRFDDVDDVALTLETMVDTIDLLSGVEQLDKWEGAVRHKSIGEVIDQYIGKETPFLDRYVSGFACCVDFD